MTGYLTSTLLGRTNSNHSLEDGTTTAFSEEELPLRLPKADNIKPSGVIESPLANITDQCGRS